MSNGPNVTEEDKILRKIINITRKKLASSETELNILDILQSYDNYIKKNKIPIDLKTKVYKSLLKWSRENVQNSSTDSHETSLNDLEHDLRFASPNEKDTAKEEKIKYEPQGGDELNEILLEENLNHSKRMKLPKLTFDDVEENKSDVGLPPRTSKPPIGKRKSLLKGHKSSEDPFVTLGRECQGRISTRESFNGSKDNNTPSFRKTKMEMTDNTSPVMGGSFQRKNRNSCLSTTNDKESYEYLPKMSDNRIGNRFSDLMNSYDSEDPRNSSSSLSFQNEQLSLSYRISKLYQKSWKSILLVKMRNMQEAVLKRMARNHYRRKIQKKCLKGIMYHTQKSLIEKLEKSKGEEIYKFRMYRKVITSWKTVVYQQKKEDEKVAEIQSILDYKKKLVLMRKWKESVLSTQVRRAQTYTAEYVHKKKILKKGMHGLKLFKAASKFEKCRWNNAARFEQVKLLTIAFKTLHWYKSKKKLIHNLQLKMDSAYDYLTKKRGFKLFVRKSRECMQKKKLYELSLNFYQEKLLKKYYEILKDHTLLKKGLRDQQTCIQEYHKERTQMKVVSRLREFTKEKKEYRLNALLFKHR